jgi:hypothetical protein
MRCVLVSEANLKADTCCTYCRKKIGDSYAREIGSRYIYCNYDCYEHAAVTPLVAVGSRKLPANSWTVRS